MSATGLLQLVETGRPRGNYFFGVAKKLGVAYTTMVISNEVILTALICARIIHIRRWYDTKAGWRSHTGAVSIVVESALPCTLFGLAYLLTFALATDYSVFFLSIYTPFTVSTCIPFLRKGCATNRLVHWLSSHSVHIAADDHTACDQWPCMVAHDYGDYPEQCSDRLLPQSTLHRVRDGHRNRHIVMRGGYERREIIERTQADHCRRGLLISV